MVTRPTPSGSPSSERERRQWHRAPAEWPITIRLQDGDHEAKLRDVSRGGICFFLDRPIREMTVLRMEFDLPVQTGLRRISGMGAVVRCERISQALDHYEIAVFLQDMAQPDRETVEAYVRHAREAGDA